MVMTEISYQLARNVATITLNRPARLNAFTAMMCQELIEAFDVADADDRVRAVVVTGAGRAFCAGADLSSGARTFAAEADVAPFPTRLLLAYRYMTRRARLAPC
jgi:enoyl-CoA hydratase/carnithine racemase